jgi:hypothetical protein
LIGVRPKGVSDDPICRQSPDDHVVAFRGETVASAEESASCTQNLCGGAASQSRADSGIADRRRQSSAIVGGFPNEGGPDAGEDWPRLPPTGYPEPFPEDRERALPHGHRFVTVRQRFPLLGDHRVGEPHSAPAG